MAVECSWSYLPVYLQLRACPAQRRLLSDVRVEQGRGLRLNIMLHFIDMQRGANHTDRFYPQCTLWQRGEKKHCEKNLLSSSSVAWTKDAALDRTSSGVSMLGCLRDRGQAAEFKVKRFHTETGLWLHARHVIEPQNYSAISQFSKYK